MEPQPVGRPRQDGKGARDVIMEQAVPVWVVVAGFSVIVGLAGWIARAFRDRLRELERQGRERDDKLQALQLKHAEDKAELAMKLTNAITDGVGKVYDSVNKMKDDMHNELVGIKEGLAALAAQVTDMKNGK